MYFASDAGRTLVILDVTFQPFEPNDWVLTFYVVYRLRKQQISAEGCETGILATTLFGVFSTRPLTIYGVSTFPLYLVPNRNFCAVFSTRPEPSHQVQLRFSFLPGFSLDSLLGVSCWAKGSGWIHSFRVSSSARVSCWIHVGQMGWWRSAGWGRWGSWRFECRPGSKIGFGVASSSPSLG